MQYNAYVYYKVTLNHKTSIKTNQDLVQITRYYCFLKGKRDGLTFTSITETPPLDTPLVFANTTTQVKHNDQHHTLNIQNLYM